LIMLALAVPALRLSVNQNQLADSPSGSEAVQAGRVLQASLGGAVNPNTYVIDTGRADGVYDPTTYARLGQLAKTLGDDSSVVKSVTWASPGTSAAAFRASGGAGLVDATGRYALMDVAPYGDALSASGRHLNDLMRSEENTFEQANPRVRAPPYRRSRPSNGLPPRRLRALPVAHPARFGPRLPGPPSGLPLGGAAAQGGASQPALDPRHLRAHGARLPEGLRGEPARR